MLQTERPPSWLGRLLAKKPAQPSTFMRVLNLTRHTILGGRIEIAESAARRNKGLLGRDGLHTGEGLWIVPCEAVHTFAMRFSIDLIYLDRKQRVVKVRSCVPPQRVSGALRAHSILELPAGTIEWSRTERGDQLQLHRNDF